MNTRHGIYAFIDTLVNDIAGPIQTMAHPAMAVRLFRDIATDAKPNQINQHLNDFQLERLGWIDADLNLIPDREVLLTGSILRHQLNNEAQENTK